MLKMLTALAALAFITSAYAQSTVEIGVQWNFNPGFNSQWTGLNGGGGCGAPNQGGNNCMAIPAGTRVRGCVGTFTAKTAGDEVLGRLLVGTGTNVEILWMGEIFGQSTHPVTTPPALSPNDPLLAGGNNLWVEYQANSSGGAGTEFQVTCNVW
jgi:hypothetical protein